MKRIFAVMGMCAVLVSAGGCAVQQSAGSVSNRMNGAFTSELTMTTADSETKAVLTRYGRDAWSVTFTEPPALSGVQLDFIDNEVTASYKGLEFSVPQSAQAVKTMLSELMDIVDGMAEETDLNCKQDENGFVCEGEVDEGGYTLTFNKEGAPVEFSLPPYGLTVSFDTFTENGSAKDAAETEATAAKQSETTAETASETTEASE